MKPQSHKEHEGSAQIPEHHGSFSGIVTNPRIIIRHGLAVALFWMSGRFLSGWYIYWSHSDYVWFAVSLLAGICLAGAPWLRSVFKETSRKRLLLVLLLLFLMLPWGEWLRLNMARTREPWSKQIFGQVLFLYGVLSLLRLFPLVQKHLVELPLRFLRKLASTRVTWIAFPVVFFLYSAWIGMVLYRSAPIVQDSAAQLFQAKIFAHGFLTAPAPPVPEAFRFKGTFLAIYEGRWFCMYQPGLSLMLAPLVLIRLEWLLCPLLGALTLAIWMDYIRRWHNALLAVVFGILFLFSPFTSMMSSTVMVHTPEVFIASAILYYCRREIESPARMFRIFLLVLSTLMMLVRAFSILPFLAPVFIYMLRLLAKERRWSAPVFILTGIVAGATLLGFYYSRTTGSPWIPPYRIVHPDYRYGFGKTLEGNVHTPARGLENTSNHLLGLDSWLTGFYSGSLFFLLAIITLRRKFTAWDSVLLLSCFCVALFYFGFVVQDLVFGPRYFYLLSPVLLFFIAQNLDFDAADAGPNAPLIAAALIVSFVSFLPSRLPYFLQRYHPTDNQSRILAGELEKVKARKMIVFLDPPNLNFINWNDPFLASPAILCRNLPDTNASVQSYFPQYEAAYFQQAMGDDFREIRYRIATKPGLEDRRTVSLFSMAMTIQAASNYPSLDLFDIGYGILFPGSDSSLKLQFLTEKEKTYKADSNYRYQLGLGLIRLGKWILLPRQVMVEHPQDWQQFLDTRGFREQYDEITRSFQEAGEVGKPVLQELEKTGRRIDRNGDHYLSEEEIRGFLEDKFRSLQGDR